MDDEIKRFYALQYDWKRIEWPKIHSARDPLASLVLDLSHASFAIYALIDDVLSRKRQFETEDIARLIEEYSQVKRQLESLETSACRDQLTRYVDRTLQLLTSALLNARPSP